MLLAAAFVLHLLPFAVRPALIGGDEPHYALMAHSIATDGDLQLRDDYEEVEAGSPAAGRKRRGEALDRHVRVVGGREVPIHPAGLPALLALPVAVQHALAPASPPDVLLGLSTLLITFAAVMAGAHLLARREGGRSATVLVLVFSVYYASPLWFYSRTFFTEPWTWALAVLAVAAIAKRRLWLAALLLGLALATKETALLIVGPLIAGTCALLGWRAAAILCAGPAAYALAFAAKNLVVTGIPFTTFQTFQAGDLAAGCVGLLFDPSRGLAWFAPLLVVSMAGWLVRARDPEDRVAGWVSLAIFGSYVLLSGAWVDWRGGSSYGPRLIVPALPALAVPLARLWSERRRWREGLALLAVAGFAVGACAALDPFTAFWGPPAVELLLKNWGSAAAGALAAAGILWRGARRERIIA
jgi:hypothetical protein